MREIKFRAWGIEQKDWVSEVELNKSGAFIGGTPSGKLMPFGKVVWCQYTGLKDKNGKAIFDGDIVEWNSWNKDSSFAGDTPLIRSIVNWSEKRGAWILGENDVWNMGIYSNIAVIGNIYENPELLITK